MFVYLSIFYSDVKILSFEILQIIVKFIFLIIFFMVLEIRNKFIVYSVCFLKFRIYFYLITVYMMVYVF